MGNYYDIIVIGGGSAGLTAAFTARVFKKKVALIEKDKIGGECTWTGCVPSKALLKAARIAYKSQQAHKYGITTDCSIDTAEVMNYVHSVRQQIYQEENPEALKKEGIEYLAGRAEFINRKTLKLNQNKIKADKIIIAAGSLPVIPPIEGINEVSYLTNQSLFELNSLPESLLIIGGGPLGVEISQALNRLRVEVTLVQRGKRILKKEEPDLSKALEDKLTQEGVNLLIGQEAFKVEEGDEELILTVRNENGEKKLKAESLLIAAGRKANTESINLDKIGIETGQQGVITDNKMRTNISNIYACGDIVGPYHFSHIAYHEALTATINAALPLSLKKMDYNNVLWVTYTDPELAHLGLTEQKAREKYGNKIKIYQLDYSELDRAVTESEKGQAKFICDKRGKLLGAHILGARAGEIIHACQIIKTQDLPFKKLQSVIHSYPTYSEIIRDASREAYFEDWADKLKFLNKLF